MLLPPNSVGGATLVPALVLVLKASQDQHPALAPPDRPFFSVLEQGVGWRGVSGGLAGQGDLETQQPVQGGRGSDGLDGRTV